MKSEWINRLIAIAMFSVLIAVIYQVINPYLQRAEQRRNIDEDYKIRSQALETIHSRGAGILGAIDSLDLACKRLESYGVDLKRCKTLNGMDLHDTDLSGANLGGFVLNGTILNGATLRNANLRYADLTDASLSGANLTNANFANANLRGANLTSADLREAYFGSVENTNEAKPPLDPDSSLSAPPTLPSSPSGANLEDTDFRGARNLKPEQVRSAQSWERAIYDEALCKQLGVREYKTVP